MFRLEQMIYTEWYLYLSASKDHNDLRGGQINDIDYYYYFYTAINGPNHSLII